MKKDCKKINKHYKAMEDHYESIIDSIQLDEKTVQMFATLFRIASTINDKTMNKIAKEVDNFRKNSWQENIDYLKTNGYKIYEEDEIYDGLFNFDE